MRLLRKMGSCEDVLLLLLQKELQELKGIFDSLVLNRDIQIEAITKECGQISDSSFV